MKVYRYKYKLTPCNRHLADFFKGVAVDEDNSILWSDQDLSYFCDEICEGNDLLMTCIAIPVAIAFWSVMGIIAACKLFPPTKKFAWKAEQRIDIAVMSRFRSW